MLTVLLYPCRRFTEEFPSCVDLLMLRALVSLLTGEFSAAITHAELALALDPNNEKAEDLRTRILGVESKKMEGTLSFLQRAWQCAINDWTSALHVRMASPHHCAA